MTHPSRTPGNVAVHAPVDGRASHGADPAPIAPATPVPTGRPVVEAKPSPAGRGIPDAPPRAADLRRAVSSILVEEIRFQRGEDLGREAADWTSEMLATGPELRADSLELIGLTARLNQAFHLHETGGDERLRRTLRLGDWTDIVAESLDRPDALVTFLTSGSTGEPKACTHPLSRLAREAASLARHFAGRRRIVATAPAHHIYGFLFTVLLPARLQVPVLDVRGRIGSDVRRRLEPGDLVVSFPLGWDELASAPGSPPPDDVRGVTSTGPCPPEVLERAAAAGFGPITEVYGSSETGGIGMRDDASQPYALMEHVHRGSVERAAMDRLEWLDERRFHVLGRRDRVVQVGGINVFPDRVAAALRMHPAVADARVRLMRPEEGRRLKAFVVPRDPAADEGLRAELDRWLAERFEAAARPRAIRLGPELPRAETGKAADWDALPPAA